MKMNKTALSWTLIALAIVTPLLYAWYIHYQRNHFSCESHLTIVDDNYILDVVADYSFSGGTGNYETSGDYIQLGQPPVPISNKIEFNYWREGDSVIMVSSDTNERPKRSQAFRHNIPDFFQVRDRGLKMEIIPANASSYLFIYGNAPVFYCTKG
ncbi:hypothetical protein QQF21_09875 [Lelliottia sp. V89_10]|uniref:hypothetical protein n=1 Tax=Lelliottia wanjuensis TaxID=3050585 RepID=UPI00249F3218|nr:MULTISPECIES: hypothetical protein [unclassified Lelliottia]MDI3361335.1 hypothetical protein [Lelliottia sp. V89_13]MDK9549920.1 hypothetical protein [Lelliottia sp. V89_5]MDK9595919.1 hypothetical protein [Lelliottia sp. V89_10]